MDEDALNHMKLEICNWKSIKGCSLLRRRNSNFHLPRENNLSCDWPNLGKEGADWLSKGVGEMIMCLPVRTYPMRGCLVGSRSR